MKRKIIITLVFAVALTFSILGAIKASKDIEAQTILSIKSSVVSSVVQCCAIEGAYPKNIQYLKDNYGLVVDESKYIITYDLFASNIMPDISVLKKN